MASDFEPPKGDPEPPGATRRPRRWTSSARIARIANLADADRRTVKRMLAGLPLKGSVKQRIERALGRTSDQENFTAHDIRGIALAAMVTDKTIRKALKGHAIRGDAGFRVAEVLHHIEARGDRSLDEILESFRPSWVDP